jgi:internalin A
LKIARERIAREAIEKTGFLDLGQLGLTELPAELFELTGLRALNVGSMYVDDSGAWQLAQSRIATNEIQGEIVELRALAALNSLFLCGVRLTDLSAVGSLQNLQSLNCSNTQINDLAPLASLQNLQSLDCGSNMISGLAALAKLANLQSLDCSETQISDLAPLACLQNLQSLNCTHTQISDLAPLASVANLQSLNCFDTQISDLAPLAGLQRLQSLYCPLTQVSDLAPLAGLQNLESLYCSSTQISDLAPLARLQNLQSLDCSSTRISDLAPLAGLQSLQWLDCNSTQISDLAPLAGLQNLRSFNCALTQISDLAPLASLANLQSLNCFDTQVSDLAPLAGLQTLRSLHCPSTQISDLAPLAGLQSLESLSCSSTQISDLAPLAGLQKLESVNCARTPVRDLAPLANLQNLESLDCSDTQVSDLAPLGSAQNLQSLTCSRCRLLSMPGDVLFKASLTDLYAWETEIPGIPSEVLSDAEYVDSLENLRAHVRDLAAGADEMPDVKLMVLGNGRVGKTQICRRLRREEFDESIESTHGIVVTSAPLSPPDSHNTHLQIWDFGGQDIYHGTHALFMRSRAIFMLAWLPEAEKTPEHHHGGFVFRNQPLAYWLDYVRHFGGAASPVAIVQTRCDRSDDERMPPLSPEKLNEFRPLPRSVHYSALNDRGRDSLDHTLKQCVDAVREREGGVAVIGAGRAKVKWQIEAMRDADAERRPSERQNRTLSYDDYLRFCTEAGGISDPKQLLGYLHNAGTVFYREGLFENRIIIDQGWALESIYAVFDREKCYAKIAKQHGRFTRSDLAEWVWNAAGHGAKEQELLLSMMQSCGICFQYRPASRDGKIEAEYIAPDLLPEKPQSEIAQKWDADRPTESLSLQYPLLPQTLMRGITARIGANAGLSADYWRDGVYVYEATTGSRALIEQRNTGPWQGEITVQTQRGQAARLLEQLLKLIGEEQQRIGIAPANRPELPARSRIDVESLDAPEKRATAAPLRFTQEPAGPELFVSYAWGDDTPEGRKREEVVDRLCAAAQARGIRILRDRKTMGLGDSIAKFMNRLAQGQRIFVVLSDKYLKSPYCMFELLEIWRNCFQEEQRFLDRVRILALPDAKIFSISDRLKCATYWHEERLRIESEVKAYDITRLGTRDFNTLRMMQKFSNEVGDILEAIADKVQPRSYEEFERYALEDLIGPQGKI